VEGAGGLLVRYDPAGHTLADLAITLSARPLSTRTLGARTLSAPVLVVAAAGLGTLNHTALTHEALRARRLRTAGIVIGSWPRHPGLADQQNLADLPQAAAAPIVGILPEAAGILGRDEFLAMARSALTPPLGGTRPSIDGNNHDKLISLIA
jgi:dethiobiotin synthetase